jgi:predicted RNA-binding Zn ribbon-like protein
VNVEWMTRQVEGKPAPEPLLAVQSFANTLDVETGTDLLETPESATAWLREAGLVTPELRISKRVLEYNRGFRESVRRLLAANESGKPDPEAARTLHSVLGDSRHHVPLDADREGGLALDLSPARDPHELMAKFLGIVFEAQVEGTWPRLKLCENPECQWAFYDSSKNRSGSWCRMGQCGNRIKNRAYRERKKTASS